MDVSKLFIVAVKAGYELNMTPAELIQRVDSVPHQSAGRDLMPEEVNLRNTWIHVVNLVLETLIHERKVKSEDAAAIEDIIRETFSSDLLTHMKARHDEGDTFQLDYWLEKYSFPKMDDQMEKVIMSQSLRLIWFTFTVLEEEQRCFAEKSGLKAQPRIPGAFD